MKPLRASDLRIRRKVEPLVARVRRLPVDVAKIAQGLGAEVRYLALAPDVPGILYRDGDRRILVANSRHSKERQRLTLARMLGHLEMHSRQPVRVDRGLYVDLRDPWVGSAESLEEVEADAFAMHLLMPVNWMQELAREGRFDFSDERALAKAAGRFGVSVGVLCFRLMTFSQPPQASRRASVDTTS